MRGRFTSSWLWCWYTQSHERKRNKTLFSRSWTRFESSSLYFILVVVDHHQERFGRESSLQESGGLNSRVNNYYEREKTARRSTWREFQELERQLCKLVFFSCSRCWRIKNKKMMSGPKFGLFLERKWMKRENEDDDDDDGTQVV